MNATAELIDGTTGEIIPVPAVEPAHLSTLFNSEDPGEVITKATATANALANVLKAKNLTTTISGREHVRIEGWTLLGSMLGVFPITVWTRKLEDGWEARVEARTRAGEIVGGAEAECLRSESTWKTRDDYALRSMAQTRAASKALAMPLRFIVSLAGYDGTPAEEMSENGTAEREQANLTAVDGVCPLCDSALKIKEGVAKASGKPYRFVGCSAYPKCKFTDNDVDRWLEPVGADIDPDEIPF